MECPVCSQVSCLCGSLLRTRLAAQTADRKEAEEFMQRNDHLDALQYTMAAIKHGAERARQALVAEGGADLAPDYDAGVRKRFELLQIEAAAAA